MENCKPDTDANPWVVTSMLTACPLLAVAFDAFRVRKAGPGASPEQSLASPVLMPIKSSTTLAWRFVRAAVWGNAEENGLDGLEKTKLAGMNCHDGLLGRVV